MSKWLQNLSRVSSDKKNVTSAAGQQAKKESDTPEPNKNNP